METIYPYARCISPFRDRAVAYEFADRTAERCAAASIDSVSSPRPVYAIGFAGVCGAGRRSFSEGGRRGPITPGRNGCVKPGQSAHQTAKACGYGSRIALAYARLSGATVLY